MRVRTEAKREAIVKAAAEVFRESGFEGASMAEIAARVGGSKATLYGYFGSKEELFVEVTLSTGKSHFEPLFLSLDGDADDMKRTLQRFGERTSTFLCTETSLQARRAIIAESGRTRIGLLFFDNGPRKGIEELGRFLQSQMDKGKLRHRDPLVAARHLVALLDSETVTPCLLGVQKNLSRTDVRDAVSRALETFLAGFAPLDAAAGGQPAPTDSPDTAAPQ